MHVARILSLAAVAAALSVSLLVAQEVAPRLDPATAVVLEGAVVSFEQGPGKPAILVVEDTDLGKTVVRLGPSWYLEGIGFAAADGESVKIDARHCFDCAAGLVAVRVDNLTTGAIAELRDDDGRPVWRGSGRARAAGDFARGQRHGRGMGCGWGMGGGRGMGGGQGKGCGHGCGHGAGAGG